MHRRLRVGICTSLLLASACGTPAPESVATVPAATESPRPAERVWLRGIAGSAAGAGGLEWTEESGRLEVSAFDGRRLSLRFREKGQTFPNRFHLELIAPEGERLVLGRYSPAWQNPEPDEATLGFSWRDCGDGTGRKVGWFVIHELVHDPLTGELARLAVDFEHRCREPLPSAAVGQIRFASDWPVDELWVPTALYWRDQLPSGEGPLPVARLGLPETRITVESATPGRVAFLITGEDGLPWALVFAAAGAQPLARGRYHDGIPKGQTRAREGNLGIERTDGQCQGPTGWFDIQEIAFRADGTLDHFAAGFGRRCTNGIRPRGEIRWNSSQPLHQELAAQRTAHRGDRSEED